MHYLTYDIKGIQPYIFRIQRLKYIVGGSALVGHFDRFIAANMKNNLFSGGGKGAFECEVIEEVKLLQQQLRKKAHEFGFDIAFGHSVDYSEAANCADDIYPYLPQQMEGHPCPESGLYPVDDSRSLEQRKEHELVALRRHEDYRFHYEKEFIGTITLPDEIAHYKSVFFHNVDGESRGSAFSERDRHDGRCGAAAIGDRNRWAIIAMDGNDMGSQFRVQSAKTNNQIPKTWIRHMSTQLDECTRNAFKAGLQTVINSWLTRADRIADCVYGDTLHLPLRPLVVGGDDIIVLCHSSYAMEFVKAVCDQLRKLSSEAHQAWTKDPKNVDSTELWPATGGQLTISAGVLFAPVSLPLATAIPYAESLLASAKNRGREGTPLPGHPSPECLDWECVTSSLLEHPANMRQREMLFLDNDIHEKVSLTCRPYTLEKFKELEKLCDKYADKGTFPRNLTHQVLTELRKSYWERKVYSTRIAKSHRLLHNDLDEPQTLGHNNTSRWRMSSESHSKSKDSTAYPLRETDVLDALLLLEEGHRMSKTTLPGQES